MLLVLRLLRRSLQVSLVLDAEFDSAVMQPPDESDEELSPLPQQSTLVQRVGSRIARSFSVCPNFSGKWALNHERSDSQSALLKALGIPWAARAALARAPRTVCIEHDGREWVETVQAPVITRTTYFLLDGVSREEVVWGTTLRVSVVVEGNEVVQRIAYPDGDPRAQVVRKRLVDGGSVYHVHTTLTVHPDGEYVTNTYFDKVDN